MIIDLIEFLDNNYSSWACSDNGYSGTLRDGGGSIAGSATDMQTARDRLFTSALYAMSPKREADASDMMECFDTRIVEWLDENCPKGWTCKRGDNGWMATAQVQKLSCSSLLVTIQSPVLPKAADARHALKILVDSHIAQSSLPDYPQKTGFAAAVKRHAGA